MKTSLLSALCVALFAMGGGSSGASNTTGSGAGAWDGKQIASAVTLTYSRGALDAQKHKNIFVHTRAALTQFLRLNAAGIAAKLTHHPKNAVAQFDAFIGSHDQPVMLRCSESPGKIHFRLISDSKGKSFAVFEATDKGSEYLIYDYRQAGKKGYDKKGYSTATGGCAKKGVVPSAVASKTLKLQ
jgi:hypothetical protein